jgi:hypothetical protein
MDQARRATVAQQVREFAAGSESEYVFSSDLSVEERKVVKSVAEMLGLRTQSFGMGADRRIHVFPPLKPTQPSTRSEVKYSVKNTFVDWPVDTQEDVVGPEALSLPAGLFRVHLAEPDDAGGKLSSINVTSSKGTITPPTIDSLVSTDAEPSDTESVEYSSSDRESVPVKNTFVHFVEVGIHEDVDPRIIQSMPAGSFADALEKEADVSLNQSASRTRSLNILVEDLDGHGSSESDQVVFPSTPDAGTALGPPISFSFAPMSEETHVMGFPPAMWAPTGLSGDSASGVPLQGDSCLRVGASGQSSHATAVAGLGLAQPCLTPGTGVIICNLERQPAFNGLRGTVHSFDSDNGRYNVLLDSTEHCGQRTAKLKPENLILEAPVPNQGSREFGKAMLVLDQLIA